MQPYQNNGNRIRQIELRMEMPYVRNKKKGLFSSLFSNSSLYFIMITISRSGSQLSGQIGLRSFTNSGKNEYLPFADTVYNYNQYENAAAMPDDVFFMCSVIKCRGKKQSERALLKRIQADSSYLKAVQRLMSVIPETVSYPYAVHLGMQVAYAAGEVIGKNSESMAEMACHIPVTEHLIFQPTSVPVTYNTKHVDFNMELLLSTGRKLVVSDDGLLHEELVHEPALCMQPM